MKRRRRSRLTYANVMVTALTFVVLGGGAYAVTNLPKNSVRSRNIVDGQVRAADLAAGSVTAPKVQAGSLTRADTNLQWAHVDKAGKITEQSGGVSVKSDSSGEVLLDFGRSVLNRSIQVTPVFSGKDVSPGPFGAWATVAICGSPTNTGADRINCDSPYNSSRYAVVATFTSSSKIHTPHSFIVTVF